MVAYRPPDSPAPSSLVLPDADRDARILAWLLADIGRFSVCVWPDKALRAYQIGPARAIVASALCCDGTSTAVVFSRQSGKDEMLAQVLAFLLVLRQNMDGSEIVVALPSLIPQGQISMRRLVDRLTDAAAFLGHGVETGGDVVRVGKASVRYMSAGPGASARGATASLLLVANEAQDIDADRWDAVFDPMGASTNAATVFSGTVWTNETLLARAMQAVPKDRLFRADWRRVAEDVPAYGRRVRQRISELGEQHPFIRTEYMLLPLEGGGLLFDAGRQASMRGDHQRYRSAIPGRTYAVLVDVGGGDEEGESLHVEHNRRDSTVATVVEVQRLATAHPDSLPIYRVVDRRVWTGTQHVQLAAEVGDYADRVWRAARVVVDATGIGHGLASMLAARLGDRLTPFVFGSASKSDLAWSWLGQIGAGRYREYVDDATAETGLFWRQVAACAFAVRPGPGRLMSWSVPDAGLHDDLLLSAALCGALDEHDWRSRQAHGR